MKIKVRDRRDVEQLVIWALVDNGLGNEFVERAGRLDWRDYGTTLDLGGGRASVPYPTLGHDDALRVVQVVRSLAPDPVTGEPVMAELLIRHGRTNCRPDCCEEGVGHEEFKTNKRGQVEWHYANPLSRRSTKIAPKKIWVGNTAAQVEYYRARYALWWIALKTIVAPLNEVLTSFEATGPAAPEEPWNVHVWGSEGEQHGMLDGNTARRHESMARRGNIELPLSESDRARIVVHSAESASS